MPEWKDEIRKRLAGLKLEPARENEIVEELAQHLEDRYQELRAGGAPGDNAYKMARDELSSDDLLAWRLGRVERPANQEPIVPGSINRRHIMADILQDLRFGVRMLRKNPGFTLIAVITLALGIGANTAIFSLVNSILLNPLPYSEPDRLVILLQSYAQKGLNTWGLSQARFAIYRDQSQSFEKMAAYTNTGFNLTGTGEPERLIGASVTADFFGVLGVEPILGRSFRLEEDAPGKNVVCVLSYSFWQRRFGGDPQIIGTSLNLNNVPTEVVGVMPQGFSFPQIGVDVWVPLGLNPQRRNMSVHVGIARLKPGMTARQAEADTTAVLWNDARQNEEPPPEGADLKTIVTPLKERITGRTQKPLLVLLGAVAMVLLIACANVANLLLARATSRTREIAVRLAMGARPGRVVRQLMTESLLLAFIGAIAGTALAAWGVKLINRLPVQGIPRIEEVSVNTTVLIFTVAVTVITGLLFGLVPALRAYRLGLGAGMRDGLRGSVGPSSRRLNSALVAAQFALCVVLLIGAGLLLKSFQRMNEVDPGFRPESVLTMRISLPAREYTEAQQVINFYEGLLGRVRALPGIEAAGINDITPFSGMNNADGYIVEGHDPGQGSMKPNAQVRNISPGYFQTVGMSIIAGRDFSESDNGDSLPVVIVDETFARRYWPGGDAIGKRIKWAWDVPIPWMTIVGVVSGIKHTTLVEDTWPYMYLPSAQDPSHSMYLAVRTTGDPTAATSAIRGEIQKMNPNLPLYLVRPMSELINESLNSQRLTNLLLTSFAVLALLLAGVGIYGVMSIYVSSRTNEFGIRLALGAPPRALVSSVLKQGLLLTAIGVVAGTAGALALTQTITSLLFEVSATDPIVFAVVPLSLVLVALAACYVPARRSARVDPLVALRYE
jgi:putative ABC transport system permease protein